LNKSCPARWPSFRPRFHHRAALSRRKFAAVAPFCSRSVLIRYEDHDPTHTIFSTTADYADYALGSDTPGAGALGKLSPLMSVIYRTLYPTGDGAQAADDLCSIGQSAPRSGFPWTAFRASRLIPKHESEWANPEKWQALISAIGERTRPKPEHEEEKKRIAKLVWWDEVAAGVPGFPDSDVYHILNRPGNRGGWLV
jgi:hypothetical protein